MLTAKQWRIAFYWIFYGTIQCHMDRLVRGFKMLLLVPIKSSISCTDKLQQPFQLQSNATKSKKSTAFNRPIMLIGKFRYINETVCESRNHVNYAREISIKM